MIEDRVKIDLKKKQVSNVKVGDVSIKVKPWLDLAEVVYIVDESCFYGKQLIDEKQSDATVTVSTLTKMNMLITLLATNIDMDDLDADVLGSAGIFNIIKEKVLNYEDIKSCVLSVLGMIGDGLVITQMGNIASLDDLEKAQEHLDDYMNSGETSDKMKELIEIMLANNPKVAEELNGVIKVGEQDGNKE